MEELRAVVADAEELLKATADQTGERIAAARGKAEESLKAAKATEDYVRANPWKALGIAAGAGFAFCLLATRLG
jgi:ElaB/YqjD/DUF883 family membrane-anchored ribosome-binding protein